MNPSYIQYRAFSLNCVGPLPLGAENRDAMLRQNWETLMSFFGDSERFLLDSIDDIIVQINRKGDMVSDWRHDMGTAQRSRRVRQG